MLAGCAGPARAGHNGRVGILDAPTLTHPLVTLEPLTHDHADALAEAAAEDGLHARAWYTAVPAPDAVGAEIERRLGLHAAGSMVPWVIRRASDDRVVGMTTYMHIDAASPRLEIGSTWMSPSTQGTGVNPAMKLLMLERAFDELGVIAVEFRTHAHNHQSREAIARLGAKQDGILRNHQLWAGVLRDTVVFSILPHEWPAVRLGLETRIARR